MGVRILHLTPHLGGGIGRALVSLAEGDRLRTGLAPQRRVICLEPMQKAAAATALAALGVEVHTTTDAAELAAAVAAHDLVQLEFWNHPRTFEALARLRAVPARWLVWCHVSGLHFPRLPAALWAQPFPVALTAPCSAQGTDPALQAALARGQARVVSSGAGFERWPAPQRRARRRNPVQRARFGYLGTIGAAKMHPEYAAWLAQSARPGTQIEMLGDEPEPGFLAGLGAAAGRPGLLAPAGYCHDVLSALARWDAMVYLLNPFHYGTAEIALLEAMAAGVVPIVADHPCERDVVRHGETGWVVHHTRALAEALARCEDDADECARIGDAASAWVRERFTTRRLARDMAAAEVRALGEARQAVDWVASIGHQPWQWFQATLPDPEAFVPGAMPQLPDGAAGMIHRESTKGSVHHFARCFPQDRVLAAWSDALDRAPRRLAA